MKRLPFALIALSLSLPVVACLNNASDEDVSSGENDLSQATKDACNFAFAEVNTPVKNAAADATGAQLKMTTAVGITPGQRLIWGDYNGDGNTDFAQVKGAEEIQVYLGDGKGAFLKSKTAKKLPNLPNRKRSAIAIVSSGDFDGDGKSDLVAIATSKETGAADDAATRGDLTVLYGAKADASLEAPKDIPTLADPITAYTYYHEAGDLDGDGKADLVITHEKGEVVAFGSADRKLTASPSGFESTHVRSLAFISPKTADKAASLTIATPLGIATITYDAAHKATVSTTAFEFPTDTSRWVATPGQINILSPKGFTIVPVGGDKLAQGSKTYEPAKEAAVGEMLAAADFDGNNETELLYKVDDNKLFAACGSGARANQIVAAPLAIEYSKNLIVAGKLDLNKDGKADLVTLDISPDGEASRGTVKVYLSSGKSNPAPTLQTFSTPGGTVSPEAGTDSTVVTPVTDSSTTDATMTATDASTEASVGVKDSGTTDATAPKPDAGPKDAGVKVDAGPKPPKDAGAKPEDADDDDDDGSTEEPPPDDEGTGTKNDKPKKPTTKPSSNGASTGSASVSAIPKPQTTDDGCSTTPGSHDLSSSAFGGLAAAMMLLVRRRRNKKA